MKIVHYMTYILSLVFLVGETARRGIDYFSINTTTMVEDYLAGILLVTAGVFWSKKLKAAPVLMVAAWAYATGGMFVPFFAHLEAYLRVETFRADHPHTDLESVITKGIVWAICLTCVVITMRSNEVRGIGK